jgi:hypothetical protein
MLREGRRAPKHYHSEYVKGTDNEIRAVQTQHNLRVPIQLLLVLIFF